MRTIIRLTAAVILIASLGGCAIYVPIHGHPGHCGYYHCR
jgi:hypothetical protein